MNKMKSRKGLIFLEPYNIISLSPSAVVVGPPAVDIALGFLVYVSGDLTVDLDYHLIRVQIIAGI